MRCPFEHIVTIQKLSNGDMRPTVSTPERQRKEDMLWECLLDYWRWVAEGSLPNASNWHGGSSAFALPTEHEAQRFYDNYHDSIRFDAERRVYQFNIQIYDSPEGDTWWQGEFKIEYGKIVILSDSHCDR